jgi:hypothetical protein
MQHARRRFTLGKSIGDGRLPSTISTWRFSLKRCLGSYTREGSMICLEAWAVPDHASSDSLAFWCAQGPDRDRSIHKATIQIAEFTNQQPL